MFCVENDCHKYAWNGKKALFESLGFTIKDSQQLKEKIEKDALNKYTEGQYKLGNWIATGKEST